MPAPSGNYYDALKQLMQGAGLQPGDRGQGFADIAYWNDVGPSQYDRLAADLQGRGSDQPTGTPGSGPWQQSGRGGGPVNQAPMMPSQPFFPPSPPGSFGGGHDVPPSPVNQAPIAGMAPGPQGDQWQQMTQWLMKLFQQSQQQQQPGGGGGGGPQAGPQAI